MREVASGIRIHTEIIHLVLFKTAPTGEHASRVPDLLAKGLKMTSWVKWLDSGILFLSFAEVCYSCCGRQS